MRRKTSVMAYESIKQNRKSTYFKIIKAAKKMPNGGNFEQIARRAGLKPEQVWKRLSELVDLKIMVNTGSTSTTSKGRQSMVRKLNPDVLKLV